MPDPKTTVRLVDGRIVSTDSEEWRHESEARAICRLPTLQERRAWLDDIAKRRGAGAADRLRRTMKAVWDTRFQTPEQAADAARAATPETADA